MPQHAGEVGGRDSDGWVWGFRRAARPADHRGPRQPCLCRERGRRGDRVARRRGRPARRAGRAGGGAAVARRPVPLCPARRRGARGAARRSARRAARQPGAGGRERHAPRRARGPGQPPRPCAADRGSRGGARAARHRAAGDRRPARRGRRPRRHRPDRGRRQRRRRAPRRDSSFRFCPTRVDAGPTGGPDGQHARDRRRHRRPAHHHRGNLGHPRATGTRRRHAGHGPRADRSGHRRPGRHRVALGRDRRAARLAGGAETRQRHRRDPRPDRGCAGRARHAARG